MWRYTNCLDGYTVIGNRVEVAEALNIVNVDVYDDDVWDEIVNKLKLEWVEDGES